VSYEHAVAEVEFVDPEQMGRPVLPRDPPQLGVGTGIRYAKTTCPIRADREAGRA
jgi:hypothetical protein